VGEDEGGFPIAGIIGMAVAAAVVAGLFMLILARKR